MTEQYPSQPLYVDLDGTLVHGDLLLESFLELLKHNLLWLLLIPVWLLRGKANLKHQIASRVSVRVDLLRYNHALLLYLRQQKAQGRRLILISASHQTYVRAVADHLGLFDDAIGSDPTHNCSGINKLARIQQRDSHFSYAADHRVDLVIWQQADSAVVVDVGAGLKRQIADVTTIEQEFERPRLGLRPYVRALRPHQWLKNTLVFLPLILAHEVANIALIWQSVVAFVCFGLCASSVYVLNDLLDLPSDRQHHSKSLRPFAAGDIPLVHGLLISPVLLALSFSLSSVLPAAFTLILAVYYLCTGLYSFALKRLMLVDVIMLAALYTLRLLSGVAAISVDPSFWLLTFSMFLFFSLAVVKRYAELDYLQEAGISQSEGRGYYAGDLNMMAMFGSTSAFLAVMVFALFINDEETRNQYRTPEILWLICPLLLYMITRIWLLAARGRIAEDPIVFALKDRASQLLTLVCGVLLWLATIDVRAGLDAIL